MNNKYLINEPPLLILPSLAKAIGLNEGILLQQIHYWLRMSKHDKGGFKWIYNTYSQWLEQFPFWSEKTLRRTVRKLEDKEIIISTIEFNRSINKTKWYRIDYSVLADHTGLNDGTDLIIDEYPLLFQPSLAVKHGLNEAIFLQQLHYWITYSDKKRDDHLWVVNKYQKWLDQFIFWSVDTLKRTIKSLTENELIFNTSKYNNDAISNLRWLTINYDKFKSTSGQNDQSQAQSDRSSMQCDQTQEQSAQTQTQLDHSSVQCDRTQEQSDHSLEQFDQTQEQSDQSPMHSDHQTSADCPPRQCNVTDSHIYITETITETTDIKDKQSDNQQLGKNLFELLPELQKTEVVAKAFEDVVAEYKKLIDNTKTIRKNQKRLEDIRKLLSAYGQNAIHELFENIKKSDFLLGFTGSFKPAFTFILNNAEDILSGKYESEEESMYERSQKCSAANETCLVIENNYPPKPYCKFCDKYLTKDKKAKKTEEEIEAELLKKCSSKDYCVLKRLRRTHSPFPYCIKCPKNDFVIFEEQPESANEESTPSSTLKTQAEKCYQNCNGCCAVRVYKTDPLPYCKFCPGNDDPDEHDKQIKADPSDSEAVWKSAYTWADHKKKQISGFIKDFEVFSTYSLNDYKQEVLIVVFEVMQEMLAENNGIIETIKFEERIWNQFRNRFTKNMQTIPAKKDILAGGNKAACEFLDYDDLQDYISSDENNEALNASVTQDIIKNLTGILTIREEEVLDYVLGVTAKGKLSQRETAELLGTTRENIAMIQKKAFNKISSFCRENEITSTSTLETIKFKVRTYQKQKFKDPSKFKVFEIGSIVKFHAS